MTGTPTGTVVSEERLRSLLEAISADVLEGDNRLYTSAHVTLPMKADSLRSAITELLDRRTAAPPSGGVVVKGLEWGRDHIAKVWHGNVVKHTGPHYLVHDDGRWCLNNTERRWVLDQLGDVDAAKAAAQADYEARIRSTLADPIPEAPADEEVEGALDAYDAETRKLPLGHENRSRGASTYNWRRSVVDEIRALIALRRSTETDKPGVREAVEEAATIAKHMGGEFNMLQNDNVEREVNVAVRDACYEIERRIRALSASPLTEEQPVAKFKLGDRVRKTKGSSWRGHVVGTYSTGLTPEGYNVESENEPGSVQLYPAAALETLPRSTTGGAK